MAIKSRRPVRDYVPMLLIVAALLVIAIGFYLREIQALLPIASMLLAFHICLQSNDRNVRRFAGILTFAFGASTLSNIAWYLIPAVVDNSFVLSDLYYYASGMFWMIGYIAITYVLFQMRSSRQWYLETTLNRVITAAGGVVLFAVSLFVFLNMNWSSNHLVDIFILLTYLCLDVLILTLIVKLLSMNLKIELRHLLMATMVFFAINMAGDILFESRWLFNLSKLLTLQIGNFQMTLTIRNATNNIYDFSLMVMTILLFLFALDPLRVRKIDEIKGRLKDTQLFVDDLISKSPDATCIFDRNGRLVLVNDQFLQIFGLKRKDIDRSFNIFGHNGRKMFDEEAHNEILKVRDAGAVIIPKLKLKGIPGGRQDDFYLYLKMFPTYSSGGRVSNYVLIIEEITTRIEMETALRQSEEKFRVLAETSPAAICLFRDERFVYVNPAVERISGYAREEFAKMNLWDLLTPEYRRRLQERLMAREQGAPVPSNYELCITSKSKELKWVSISIGSVNINDTPAYIVSAFDITERKRMEDAIQHERSQLLSIFDSIDEMIYVADPSTYEILFANKAMQDKFGKKLIGGTCYREFQNKDAPCEFCTNPIILKDKGVPYRWEFHNPIVDRDLLIVDRIIKWPDGRDVRFEYTIDITDRRQAEEALRKSEASLARAQEIAHLGSWSWDIGTNEQEWSDESYRIFGFEPGEVRPDFDLFVGLLHPDDREQIVNHARDLMERDVPYNVDYRIVRRDGAIRHIHAESQVVRDGEGRAVRVFGINLDITDRRLAEEARRESEEKFRAVFEQAAVGITWVDLEGRFLQTNQKFRDITGYTSDELTRLSVSDITYAPDIPEEKELIGKLLRCEIDTFSREKRYVRKDGSLIWVFLRVSLIRENGIPKNFVGVTQDITERKQFEEALRESEDKYRNIVEQSSDGILISDDRGIIVEFNAAQARITGRDPKEWIGRYLWDYIAEITATRRNSPDQKKSLRTAIMAACKSGYRGFLNDEMEVTIRRPDGETRTINIISFVTNTHSGKMFGSMVRDVTERKRIEEALRESEEQYRNLVENVGEWIWENDRESRFTYSSPKVYDLLGYRPEEVIGLAPHDLMTPGNAEKIREQVKQLEVKREFPQVLEVELLHKDGHTVFLEVTGKPVYDRQGNHTGFRGVSRDVTARKRAEEALRESEEKFRVLAETSPAAIVIYQDESIVYVNPAFEKTVGYTPEELLAMKPWAFMHPDYRGLIKEKVLLRKRGLPLAEYYDAKIVTKDGRELWSSNWTTTTTYRNRPAGLIIAIDITDRVRLEEELRNAYDSLKAEYKRRIDFTNAAAHELRTPLTPIIGYTDILKAEVKDERHRQFLEIIERNALRQKTLVNRMLELASLDAGMAHVNRTEFPLRPLVLEIADNYRAINSHIRAEVPEGMRINTDMDILRHVLDNLVSNAVKYSDNDKEIEVRVAESGDSYQFAVKDRGAGIPKEEWGKIFERFYIVGGECDSRASGRCGLGLALVKAYIRLIGGNVWLESEPGKGSTFFFTIPRNPAPGSPDH